MPFTSVASAAEIERAGPVSLMLILGITALVSKDPWVYFDRIDAFNRHAWYRFFFSVRSTVNFWTLFILLLIISAIYHRHIFPSELISTLAAASSAPCLAEILSLLWLTDTIISLRFGHAQRII